MVVGGFEKVYEIGRIFRNEGISTRHNPEFTSVEMYQAYADYHDMMDLAEGLVTRCALAIHGSLTVNHQMYQAYADYHDMMDLAEGLVTRCALAIHGSLTVNHQGKEISYEHPWRRALMHTLVQDATGVDFFTFGSHLAAAQSVAISSLSPSYHNAIARCPFCGSCCQRGI